jgi:hypothetical protein
VQTTMGVRKLQAVVSLHQISASLVRPRRQHRRSRPPRHRLLSPGLAISDQGVLLRLVNRRGRSPPGSRRLLQAVLGIATSGSGRCCMGRPEFLPVVQALLHGHGAPGVATGGSGPCYTGRPELLPAKAGPCYLWRPTLLLAEVGFCYLRSPELLSAEAGVVTLGVRRCYLGRLVLLRWATGVASLVGRRCCVGRTAWCFGRSNEWSPSMLHML